jgi:hypothetical protein
MRPEDVLHHINNQLEIVVSAAQLLTRTSDREMTKECCAQIHSAAFTASAVLKRYFDNPDRDKAGPVGRPDNTRIMLRDSSFSEKH